jgi:hypothetical protein
MKKITAKRLAEIKTFNNTNFSNCPELTDEQLAQIKPSLFNKYLNKIFILSVLVIHI